MGKTDKITVKILIKEALLELMTEKPYMDITVTDIIKKANVARVSYYRNYCSIDEILDSIVEDKMNKIKNRIQPMLLTNHSEEEWIELLHTIFEHKAMMNDNLTLTRECNRPYLFMKMEARFQEFLFQQEYQTVEEKYRLPAKIGVLNSLAEIWVKTGRKETVDELVDIAYTMIKKI
ncbi:MAG: hypothetical protein R3Y58_12440 [Eubacteriales bacterium]